MIFKYDNININIHERYNKYHIGFTFNNKRVRKSTGLLVNTENLQYLKLTVIPEIFQALTKNKNIEFLNKEIILSEYSIKFFNVHKEKVRSHIHKQNINLYDNHILPLFGKLIISDIKPLNIEEWQVNLTNKYSVYTVKRIRSIFNMILDSAYKNDLISFNPFTKVSQPINKQFKKLESLEDEIDPFNTTEIKTILENSTPKYFYFFYIMLLTGMRPGEIVSLTWKDIDFEKRRIAVDKTTVLGNVGNVKTSSSVRYVDIVKPLYDMLKKFYNNSLHEQYLFTTKYGKPYYNHTIFARTFKTLLENNNIRHRNLYNLRHTFATNMILDGIDLLWISNMLGHKDISVTQEVYIRFIKEDDDKRLEKLKKINPKFVTKIVTKF